MHNKVNAFKNLVIPLLFTFLLFFSNSVAQTSGKISGRVVDENGQPLISANVLLMGTNQGAATDLNGYYTIVNVRAGKYSLKFGFIGYQTKIIKNVRVNGDRTTQINVQLNPELIQSQEVVVVAKKPLVEFNSTSSVSTITEDDIKKLPIQSLNEIVNLQAGVVDGHFRGGRLGEVQFQVDGVTVNNPYNNSSTLQLDRSVLQEVQVISGTFDAKYGQAMSGVVNAILKTGTDKFAWSGEVYSGNYFTTDTKRYPHNNKIRPSDIQNYQLTVSGPVLIPATTFFLSGRRFISDGYLYGVRKFLPTDKNDFEKRIFNPTGDNKLVPMQTRREWSGQFKITNHVFKNINMSYQAIYNDIRGTRYNNAFRINPDGINSQKTISLTHGLDFTQTLSQNMFYKLSIRQNYFKYSDYKYPSVYDPRYIIDGQPKSDANFEDGAIVQGVNLSRFEQETNSGIIKGQFSWQVNRINFVETGVEFQTSKMLFGSPGFLDFVTENGVQKLKPRIGTRPEDPKVETYYPNQFAAYLQDRVEWGDIVVRAGLRLQYFDANAKVPSDLQNPANSIKGAPQSHLVSTTPKVSLAPRLGFSFPLTDKASIYFSYGHFYQMPNLSSLYTNSNYLVLKELQAGGVSFGVLGNPDLKPQKTIQYETGLKQALTSNLGVQVSFFYKDIRDLLGSEFVSTYTAAEYARLTNVDFGSAYGFTISLDQRAIGPISTSIDYTLQFANGNSSDPNETANRAAAGKDPRPRDIPFNWDQRHTLNVTAILSEANNYSVTTIIKFGSGQPYTPAVGTGFNADLETNSGRKSNFVLVDLRAEKIFNMHLFNMSVFLRIFNLFNAHSVNGFVFSNTGSPDYSQFPVLDRVELANPARFHQPRRIELGISFSSN